MAQKYLIPALLMALLASSVLAQQGGTFRLRFDHPYNIHPQSIRSARIAAILQADTGRALLKVEQFSGNGQMRTGSYRIFAFQPGDSAVLKRRGKTFPIARGNNQHYYYQHWPLPDAKVLSSKIQYFRFSDYLNAPVFTYFDPDQPHMDTSLVLNERPMSRSLPREDSLIYALVALNFGGQTFPVARDTALLVAFDLGAPSLRTLDTIVFPNSVGVAGDFDLSFRDSSLHIAHELGNPGRPAWEIWEYSLQQSSPSTVDTTYIRNQKLPLGYGRQGAYFFRDSLGQLQRGYQGSRGQLTEQLVLNANSWPAGYRLGTFTVSADSSALVIFEDTSRTHRRAPLLWKFSPRGQVLWNRAINLPYTQKFVASVAQEPSTGSIWLGGTSLDSIGSRHHYAFLARMDSSGRFVNLRPISAPAEDWQIYPQPVGSRLQLSQLPPQAQHYQILSMQGQVLRKGILEDEEISSPSLSSGSYFLRILDRAGQELGLRRFLKK